ncbi:MAG: aminopeptidase [Bulleidia sp.]|nr:aminopeptidase [Bulleidia sp.]
MPNEAVLRKYARLLIQTGVNIRKGQLLVIQADVQNASFTELCVEEAYKAGAGEVWTFFNDEYIHRQSILHGDEKALSTMPKWRLKQEEEAQERKCAELHLISSMPGLLDDVDHSKAGRIQQARSRAMKPYYAYTSACLGQWCVAAVPNALWARKVFPQLAEKEALSALWDAVLRTMYISEDNDPVQAWEEHDRALKEHCDVLNQMQFQSLHYANSLGTDLVVQLPMHHIWSGGSETARLTKAVFQANMPTEEVFTTPLRTGVNGTVVASRPLDLNGTLVEDFRFTFRDGEVIDFHAEKGSEALEHLLNTDENSRRLGEAALVPYDSPISRMNLLFYDTLFDENASCHLALGDSYPTQIEGGVEMSEEELLAHGGNVSSVHVDFMIGTQDLNITGYDQEGKEVPVFRNGSFAV